MGHLNEKYGMRLMGSVPAGTCRMCAVQHDTEQPHNQQSLTYKYKFYDLHGRWPTWKDAMEHCSDEVKQMWIEALHKRGVEV